MTVTERVKKGAIFLDQVKPEWFTLIDINTLFMESCTYCVLGQLLGDYKQHSDILHDRHVEDYGFDGGNYGLLQDAWVHEIEKRRDFRQFASDWLTASRGRYKR